MIEISMFIINNIFCFIEKVVGEVNNKFDIEIVN